MTNRSTGTIIYLLDQGLFGWNWKMTKSIPLMHGSSAKVDLYAEFGIDATASVDDIKRAYR